MDWHMLKTEWKSLIDVVNTAFPATERQSLERIGGRTEALVDYVARAQDLTRDEARETIEDRVLIPVGIHAGLGHSIAAE